MISILGSAIVSFAALMTLAGILSELIDCKWGGGHEFAGYLRSISLVCAVCLLFLTFFGVLILAWS